MHKMHFPVVILIEEKNLKLLYVLPQRLWDQI